MNVELKHPLRAQTQRVKPAIVDCDIHPKASLEAMRPYLSQRWQDYLADLRGALAPRLRQGLPVSRRARRKRRGATHGRRAAGCRAATSISCARSTSITTASTYRRDEPALAVRPGRAEPGIQRRHGGRHQRVADRRHGEPRAAAEGLDRRALRGRRGRARRDPPLRRQSATTCRCSCSAAPPRRSGAGATGRSTRPRSSTAFPVGIHVFGYSGWAMTNSGWPSFYIEEMTEHATSRAGDGDELHHGGRVRALPHAQGRADRIGLRAGCRRSAGGSTSCGSASRTRCRT